MRTRWPPVLFFMALAVSACLSLKHEPPQKRRFSLEAGRPEDFDLKAEGIVLFIRTASIALPFDSRSFVYRRSDGTWESDFYNEFLVSPAELVTEQVRRWFAGTVGSPRLVGAEDRNRATHVLFIRVNEIFGDFHGAEKPRAVLALEFDLDNAGRTDLPAPFARSYRREVPVSAGDAMAIADGWSQALREILSDFTRDLSQHGIRSNGSSSGSVTTPSSSSPGPGGQVFGARKAQGRQGG